MPGGLSPVHIGSEIGDSRHAQHLRVLIPGEAFCRLAFGAVGTQRVFQLITSSVWTR